MYFHVQGQDFFARDAYAEFARAPLVKSNSDTVFSKPTFPSALSYRTAVISDTHLGRHASFAEYLLEFLYNVSCETLILNGDIFDGWYLDENGDDISELHKRCVDALIGLAKGGTKIIYIPGNHDEKLTDPLLRLINRTVSFKSKDGKITVPITFCEEYEHIDAKGKRILVKHGHQYDSWHTNHLMNRIAHLADRIYEPLLRLSNAFRRVAINLTSQDISFITPLKIGTKWLTGAVKNFQRAVDDEISRGDYQKVICGHIHKLELSEEFGNCGDWVETVTYLGETWDGEWQSQSWNEVRKNIGLKRLPEMTDANRYAANRPLTDRLVNIIRNRLWPAKPRALSMDKRYDSQILTPIPARYIPRWPELKAA